jgi:t-SNARE complex subunit (syntaxin)
VFDCYLKLYNLDKNNKTAKNFVVNYYVEELKKAKSDKVIKELAETILKIDANNVDAHRALEMLKQKKIKEEHKKKIKLIIVIIILIIILIILFLILKPQKKVKPVNMIVW